MTRCRSRVRASRPALTAVAAQLRRSGRAPLVLKVLFGLLATSPETRAPAESPDLRALRASCGQSGHSSCWRVRPSHRVESAGVAAPPTAPVVLKEIDAASLLTAGPARRRRAPPPAAPEPVLPRACSPASSGAASPHRCLPRCRGAFCKPPPGPAAWTLASPGGS